MKSQQKTIFIVLVVITITSLSLATLFSIRYLKFSAIDSRSDSENNDQSQITPASEEDNEEAQDEEVVEEVPIEEVSVSLSGQESIVTSPSNRTVCDSNKTYDLTSKENFTLNCGDKFTVTIVYKPSTGASAFNPEYDEEYVELIKYTDELNEDPNDYSDPESVSLTGWDLVSRTYLFKSIKASSKTNILLGYHQEWDSDNTKYIDKDIDLVIQ